jgi:hypothetical protein
VPDGGFVGGASRTVPRACSARLTPFPERSGRFDRLILSQFFASLLLKPSAARESASMLSRKRLLNTAARKSSTPISR